MTLQEYWNKREASGHDIVFADGRALLLSENWCRKAYAVEEETTLEEDEKKYGTEGTAFDILGQVVNSKNGHIAYYGEGSMGNEGFVAYADKNGILFWLMYLDFSNPFWSICFEDDTLVATTELEFTFVIPLCEPEKLFCKAVNSWDLEAIEKCESNKLRGYNSVKIWNDALDLSMEWGEDWLMPIESRLLNLYPKLEKAEIEMAERLAKLARERALEIVIKIAKQTGTYAEFEVFKEEHQKEQTWINEKNMSRMFNQAMYYSMK